MTKKKPIGLLVGAFVCATVFTLNPSAAWASGDTGPAAPVPGPGKSLPAGVAPERPVPAPEKILPAPPPGAGAWCPTL
ncbi:hypothetical protein GFY24_21760 [Nocardia sp. SYP-A9097]|uniref:hypothetical protein n=1 Tax=Nocardia sp. SYP-A9097 TaxID=2663237 RepID=UPI00129B93CC|nr:hypothetical protein [Nocardia sp. SYP-A9097]MRH90033.1 hypothetical protein [Nocardia sp. SYP-A9097]